MLLPPLALLALEALVAVFSRTAYRVLHLVLVGAMAAVFFVQIEKRIFTSPTALIILVALAFGAAVAYGLLRTRFVPQPARRALRRPGRLPGHLLLLQRHLEADPPAEQRQRPRGPGALEDARRGGDLRRVPDRDAARPARPDRRPALPSLRGAGAAVDLVPEQHHRRRLHRARRARDHDRQQPQRQHPADRLRSAEQHLQPARGRLPPPRQGGGHPGLPGVAVRRGAAAPPALPPEEPGRGPQATSRGGSSCRRRWPTSCRTSAPPSATSATTAAAPATREPGASPRTCSRRPRRASSSTSSTGSRAGTGP